MEISRLDHFNHCANKQGRKRKEGWIRPDFAADSLDLKKKIMFFIHISWHQHQLMLWVGVWECISSSPKSNSDTFFSFWQKDKYCPSHSLWGSVVTPVLSFFAFCINTSLPFFCLSIPDSYLVRSIWRHLSRQTCREKGLIPVHFHAWHRAMPLVEKFCVYLSSFFFPKP